MMEHNKLKKVQVAVVFALLAVVGACEDPTNTNVAATELLELDADVVNYGMTSFLTASGVREARIQADTAFVYADSAKVFLRQMELALYHEDGRTRATVTALSGEMDTNTDAMLAQGDVVLTVHEDGRIIQTSELNYDPQRDRIWSDSATTQIMADGRVTNGTAFESDLDFRNIRIENPRGAVGEIIF
jgi:LPS export ABC transporter protein LptC